MHTQTYTGLSKVFITSFISLSLILIAAAASSTQASAATVCTLSFGIASNTASVQTGGNLTRTVTVKNTGPGVCKNTSFSLYYPGNETFVSSSPAPRAGNYYWVVGNLGSGNQATVTLNTRHNASVSGNSIDLEGCSTANNGSDACATSEVAISSSASPITAPPVVLTPPVVVTPPMPTSTVPTAPTIPTPVTPSTPTPTTNAKELGMWIWEFPKDMLSSDAQLKQLQTYGFNTVYITMDDYLDIASMADGAAKNTAKANYFATLSKFVAKANSYGLQVDAEGGWKDWAYAANKWKGFALIDAVKEYNTSYPATKLRGFQYDVEPYLLDEYETNKAKVLTEYVAFIDQSAQRFVGTNIKFSMAIPHFYDAAQAWTPAITYGGKTMHTFNHLLNILEKTPGSTILLMSYRDTFEGSNGTRNIVEAELKDAAGYSTKVIVSQETGNVDPDFVTFYGSTKTEVFSNLSQINSAFKSYASHGGNAVHYLDSFLVMKP